MHSCDNEICKLLNPCINGLLEYQDVRNRVTKTEELFSSYIRNPERLLKLYPLDLFGWCNQHMMYQLLNFEFVQELAKTIKEIDPEIILEIAAGRGIVSRHVSKIINKEIILTDDYSWWDGKEIDEKIEYPDIVKMSYNEAIKKFKPDLIIASWIPYGQYWTKDFRKCSSVKGYILIGESEGGCTGAENDWKTTWTRKDLENVERYGICRTDHGFNFGRYAMFHTNVTYFERP